MTPPPAAAPQKIIDGFGVGSIELGRSTAHDVVAAHGDEFLLIEYGSYSCALEYKHLGLTFYYWQGRPEKRIFFILLAAPFRGVTSRGVRLGETTMNEAIKLYGPPAWRTSDGADTWHSFYPGIELHVARELSLPPYPLDVSVHLPRPIIKIGLVS